MGSCCKGSDEAVFGEGRGTGNVADTKVGVSQFSVDRSGLKLQNLVFKEEFNIEDDCQVDSG